MENHFKNVFGVYDGLHDLLFAESNDDNLTEWYIVLGNCIKYIGYEYSDEGVINLSEE